MTAGRPCVFEQHALSACFDVTLPGGGNVGSDGEHYVESAPGKFIRRIAERGIEVAVEAPLSGVVLPAVRDEQQAGRVAVGGNGIGCGEQGGTACGDEGFRQPCVVNGPHEGVAGRSGAFRPGVFVYAVEVCFAQRPASLCDGWLRARRSYGEEAAVKDDIGRSTAPHHAAAARYHERDGECSATVAVTAVERCGERLCRASPREEPPPFFVAERFYAYRMGCLCRKGGRQQGERDEDWKSPVHGVVGLGISTRRSCGAFAGKCHAK